MQVLIVAHFRYVNTTDAHANISSSQTVCSLIQHQPVLLVVSALVAAVL
jgi:hypothetical protein